MASSDSETNPNIYLIVINCLSKQVPVQWIFPNYIFPIESKQDGYSFEVANYMSEYFKKDIRFWMP